jgi:hypothetical protein
MEGRRCRRRHSPAPPPASGHEVGRHGFASGSRGRRGITRCLVIQRARVGRGKRQGTAKSRERTRNLKGRERRGVVGRGGTTKRAKRTKGETRKRAKAFAGEYPLHGATGFFSPKGARSLSPAQRAGSSERRRWRPVGQRDGAGSAWPLGGYCSGRPGAWDEGVMPHSILSRSSGPSALLMVHGANPARWAGLRDRAPLGAEEGSQRI